MGKKKTQEDEQIPEYLMSEEAQRALATLEADLADARENATKCIEQVVRDEQGRFIEFGAIHKSWQAHIDYCWSNGKHAAILAPWGHGKTVSVVIGRTITEVGKNKNVRIKIVSNVDDPSAIERVNACSNIITSSFPYRRIFPHIKPSQKSSWTKHRIFVERDPGVDSIDATIEARGIFSTGIGGRADILVFDDIVDQRNAIDNPMLRPKVIDAFDNVWMSRLEPGGHALYIATPWHEGDCSAYIKRLASMIGARWCLLEERISAEKTHIEVEVLGGGDDYEEITGFTTGTKLPLFTPKWSKERLEAKEMSSPRSYQRGYRLIVIATDELVFRSFLKCVRDFSLTDRTFYDPAWPHIIGVDLASDKRPGTVAFCLAVNPNTFERIPVDIRLGRWTSPQTVRELGDMDRLYNPEIIVVENNGYQNSIIEWVHELKATYKFAHKLHPFTTGKQKADPKFGLPGLEVEFSNKSWLISERKTKDHPMYCPCGFCTWRRTMTTYPMSEETDTCMASWFAREGVLLLAGKIASKNLGRIDLMRR